MEYRKLGRSGLSVSSLCLGTMMFGARTDEAEAGRIIDLARAGGVNFIDTADVYANGESERIVGRRIRNDRDRWILATKGGNAMGNRPNQVGNGRKWLSEAVDASLERLGTDYVDLYYLHRDDLVTPLEETIGLLGDLISVGKIRYWGFSNFEAWRIAEMIAICGKLRVPRPVACQPYYHALHRRPEMETLPACAFYGIGVAPYSPLARGVLTGKYQPGVEPGEGSRAGVRDTRMMETEWRPESLEIAQKIKTHAESRGMSPIDYAVLWVLNHSAVGSVIAGPRTLEQWQAYLSALDHDFDAEDEAFLDALVPAGHASTHGYFDPKSPPLGRVVRTAGTGSDQGAHA